MTEQDFPPFMPAKPKGSIVQKSDDPGPHPLDGVVESTFKPKRKRRTREEMQAAKPNGSSPAPVDSFSVYVKIVELLEPVTQKVRLELIRMLAEHHT